MITDSAELINDLDRSYNRGSGEPMESWAICRTMTGVQLGADIHFLCVGSIYTLRRWKATVVRDGVSSQRFGYNY